MNEYPHIILKKGKESSLQRFHPWVFSGAIAKGTEGLTEGDIVEVYSKEGQYLATGHYQIGSIAVRVFSFQQIPIIRAFWKEKLEYAIDLRKRIRLWDNSQTNIFRLIHGEGDGLPGLILDYYHGVAVVQCHSIGFYHLRELLAELLQELMGDKLKAVYDKSQHTLPFKANISPQDGYLWGQEQAWEGLEYGNRFLVNVEKGQKTGFFIDQRENRYLLQHYAEGRDVLNTFCYTGGFSVAALKGGAKNIVSVDSSKQAIELTEQNIARNAESAHPPHTSYATDAFEFLNHIDQQYDLIVLDPPAFAKHRKVLDRALKGYRKINRRAFEQIRPGGILFTFSCSQVVSRDDFRRTVFTSAALAKRKVRILHQLTQPADHPVNIYHPEGEYLKGLVLMVD